jgi:hypothetical protein
MVFTIKRASWGDNTQSTDITKSLVSNTRGGHIDVKADESLIPMFSGVNSVSLTDEETLKIKTDAIATCRQDPKCINTEIAYKSKALLESKIAGAPLTLSGRKLTVDIIENGKERTVYVPEGQNFTMGTKPIAAKAGDMISKGSWAMVTNFFVYSSVFARILGIVLLFVAMRRLSWGVSKGTPLSEPPWSFFPGMDRRVTYTWICVVLAILVTEPAIALFHAYLPSGVATLAGWGALGFDILCIAGISFLHNKYFPS